MSVLVYEEQGGLWEGSRVRARVGRGHESTCGPRPLRLWACCVGTPELGGAGVPAGLESS